MSLIVSCELEIEPVAKQRPRAAGNGHFYTPKKTQEFEQKVRLAAIGQLPEGFTVPSGPVGLYVLTVSSIPASWKPAERYAAAMGEIYPSRGDLDNRVKAVSDALNGVYYVDDSQIVELVAKMRYGTTPKVSVAVYDISSLGSRDEVYNRSRPWLGR